MSKGQKIGLWIITVLSTFGMLGGGITKLMGMPDHIAHFTGWGYPVWFMYLIGVAETLGGLALLYPRTATLASGVLVPVMAGAVFTHVKAAEYPQIFPALVLSILIGIVGYARRSESIVGPWARQASPAQG
jgi:putative oxidoreductase